MKRLSNAAVAHMMTAVLGLHLTGETTRTKDDALLFIFSEMSSSLFLFNKLTKNAAQIIFIMHFLLNKLE